jgi:hypothetical protein
MARVVDAVSLPHGSRRRRSITGRDFERRTSLVLLVRKRTRRSEVVTIPEFDEMDLLVETALREPRYDCGLSEGRWKNAAANARRSSCRQNSHRNSSGLWLVTAPQIASPNLKPK